MKELEDIRKIFLADVDEETRLDNEKTIIEWETGLRENEAIAEWREHDITKKIVLQVKQSYKDHAMQLAINRTLTDEQRRSLWGKQDACLFILSLTEIDAKGAIERIHNEIKTALNATN